MLRLVICATALFLCGCTINHNYAPPDLEKRIERLEKAVGEKEQGGWWDRFWPNSVKVSLEWSKSEI